ncbi:hypothetical protein WHR41_09570 [Cladosporium halotolerans]|uniref:Protein kinase domain-containing protein n=1 Tax=Cladosporium halotolerans TaxID=1052096 RepID=A0AB34KDW8_9PEZI
MTNSSPDYKRLYEEAQRGREEEQRRREEEQRKREEAERAQQEEQRRREEADKAKEEAEKRTSRTTLPQYLDACHVHLQAGLAVQSVALSTKGDPSNARRKRRPDKIRRWPDFASRQLKIWNELVSSPFMTEGHFTSPHTMLENGENIRRRMIGSELDIHHFQRTTVEEPVSLMVERIYKDEALRNKFGLKGSVQFENHANTLSPEDALSEDMRAVELSNRGRRRSPRLLEMKQRDQDPSRPKSPGSGPAIQAQTSRPRADQFCVYNMSTVPGREERVPAFIVEYKAPHKLTLKAIQEGLRDMVLEDVLDYGESDTPRRKYQRLVAAAVTQAFSYMVSAGLEFGYVCTGQAFIFLQVPEDPATVHYFLSVPQVDVGDSTGWSEDAASSATNRLHLTAVGQVLAFTLQALQSPPRSHEWRAKAEENLATWEYVYKEILDDAPAPEGTPSEYCPTPDNELLRVSPIAPRQGRAPRGRFTCRKPSHHQAREDDSDADHSNPDTPSQPSRKPTTRAASSKEQASEITQSSRGKRGNQHTRPFCTRRCLLGLVNGGDLNRNLDRECPNVDEHGVDVHLIDKTAFLALMRKQLSRTLDSDFEPCGRPGSRGVPFRATLASHGYTVVAKCTPMDFVAYLRHEATIYERLRTIQGHCVPVHLGNLDLERPYYYEGIAKLVHVMFLGYGGTPITRRWTNLNQDSALGQVEKCLRAIHERGVLHRDVMPRNILWDCDSGRVTVIDFERAKASPDRPALGPLSVNRKRKQQHVSRGTKHTNCYERLFAQEVAEARDGISCL